MKNNTKQHIAKIFLLLGSSASLVESCTFDLPPLNQKNFAPDLDYGPQMLPIKLYVENEDYVNNVLKFTNDIINDKELLDRFSKNPEKTLGEEYGITRIDTNDTQIQILIATADTEIQDAMREKDFKKYLRILERKGLLQSDIITNLNSILKEDNLLSNVQYQTKGDTTQRIDTTTNFVVSVVALVVALAWVAAGVRLAVGIQWAAAVQAAAAVHAVAYLATYVKTAGPEKEMILEDEAITLYIDKTKDIDTIKMGEEKYIEDIREFMKTTDGLKDREDINTLFQIACGTSEMIMKNDNEK